MMSSMKWRLAIALCFCGSALGLTGCGTSADAAAEDPAKAGTLSLPLLTSAGDHNYLLDGYLQVWGPEYRTLYLGEYDDIAAMQLSTGAYSSELWAWQLYRQNAQGSFSSVSATLLDGPYRYFDILNGTTTTISYQFETDGEVVTVGSGGLKVDVDVIERPGACTPLGEGCQEGTWCAPSELVGAPLSCVVAGPVEPGAACASPYDCVANASCFDFGQGPQCAELCLSADFGQPCANGGTCSQRGESYGVCEPDVATP